MVKCGQIVRVIYYDHCSIEHAHPQKAKYVLENPKSLFAIGVVIYQNRKWLALQSYGEFGETPTLRPPSHYCIIFKPAIIGIEVLQAKEEVKR